MRRITFKYLIIILLVSLLPAACQKQPEAESEDSREGVWTKVHYSASVSSSKDTKATLDAIDRHYLFEGDDLLYVVDKATGGDDLYGYLYLVSGAGATTAVFEGDLMYFVETAPSSGKYEPERPADDLAVTATLVSKTQRDNGVYTFVENNDGKIATGPNFVGGGYASTFKEAVQKFSTFKADATYGNTSFSLVQGTAFLLFALSFDDDVPASLTVSVTNNDGAETLFTHSGIAPNVSHEASFVAAFPGGTITLSNAQLAVSDGGSFGITRKLASLPLEGNRYYNVAKAFLNLDYFTIQAPPEAGTTINFPSKYYQDPSYGLQYSSNGTDWTDVSSAPVVLAAGGSIKLRGKGNKYQNNDGSTTLFTSSATCYIYGDIMSLFCDGSYVKKTAFVNSTNNNALDGTFKNMSNLNIHPARPLLLSAQTLTQSCYLQMFAGSGITHAPEFTNVDGEFAANIPQYACKQMFQGCTALSAAPELPANGTIANQGYYGMFDGCTSLSSAPTRLAVTPSGNEHFREMFKGCSSLLFAPELPALEVKQNGCRAMFSGCSSLREAPDLPATTVASNAYSYMFENCSSLVTGPSSLPATDMNTECYRSMFKNCSLLEAAPEIAATTLAQSCFYEMFSECRALRTAQAAFAFSGDIPQTACYKMFYNCLALNGAPEMLSVTGSIATSGCEEMFSGCGEMRTAPSNLNAITVGSKGYQKMFLNCARLLDSPAIAATNVGTNGCQEMFRGCTRLQNPPATLPAMTLGNSAYYQMFYGCSTLTSAPTLPATTISESAYNGMFYNCTSLETPPSSLPGTTLEYKAYYRMFYNCSKLKEIPDFPHEPGVEYHLAAGTSAENNQQDGVCFQMFYKCNALTTLEGKQLFNSITPLKLGCFNDMFSTCDNLATVPEDFLPATTLAASCYRGMFQSCKKLTRAPNLLATTLQPKCYQYMFNTCTSLVYIKCYSTSPGSTDYTQNWLANAKNTSDCEFHYRSGVSWPSENTYGIPSNWTPVPEEVQ